MSELDVYLTHVATLADEVEAASGDVLDFLDVRHRANDGTVVDCIDIRRSLLSVHDRARLDGYLSIGFLDATLPRDTRLAGFAVALEVAEELERRSWRVLCAPYTPEDPLFVGSPRLWHDLRAKGPGRRDHELIAFGALLQENGSEVVGIPGGYGKIPNVLDPGLVAWLSRTFTGLPFFIRLRPDRFYRTRPAMSLMEEAIVPGRFDGLMAFRLHLGQKENGEYVLQDGPPDPENLDRFMDYHSKRIRRLEIRAERRKADHLTMMIEELPAPDDPCGIMVGRCIHLDTDLPNDTPLSEVRLTHLDLAVNVYEGCTRASRYACRLRDGKVTDASVRTHLMRIEGVPLLALLPICAGFLRSRTLLSEWIADLSLSVGE